MFAARGLRLRARSRRTTRSGQVWLYDEWRSHRLQRTTLAG